MNRVILSPGYFNDPLIGRPVSLGYLYIGEPDLDPEVVANQKQVSVQQESGAVVQITQPVRTNQGGSPTYNGSTVTILVSGDYSLTVLRSDLSQANHIPNVAYLNENTQVDDMLGLINVDGQADGDTVDMLGYFISSPQSSFYGGGLFVWQENLDKTTANGGTVIDPDNTGGFDGTVSTRDAFLTAQGGGVGLGCWVRDDQSNPFVEWWGAVGDAPTTDDQAAFSKGLVSLGTKGGTVNIDHEKQYLIDSNLDVPDGCGIRGGHIFIDPRNSSTLDLLGSRITLNSAATINLNESSSISNVVIIRKGIVLPADAAEVANFAGNAITCVAGGSGQYVGYSAIVGFSLAVTTAISNTEQIRCEFLNIDCRGGVHVIQCFDTAYIENCHCWPTASIGLGSPVDADLQRAGTAFLFQDGGDWNKWTNCFSFGYKRGFIVDACNSVTATGCGTDYTSTQVDLPIGFSVTNLSAEVRFMGCQAAGQNLGVNINTTSTSSNIQIIGMNIWECDAHGIIIDDGRCYISDSVIRGGSSQGVTLNNTDICRVVNTTFDNIGGNAINSTSSSNPVIQSGNIFIGVGGSLVTNPYKPTLASGATLVVDGQFDSFTVTGTTNITAIDNAAAYSGKTIVLIFEDILTVSDSAVINMPADFVTTANDTLSITSDGTNWYQAGRSVN